MLLKLHDNNNELLHQGELVWMCLVGRLKLRVMQPLQCVTQQILGRFAKLPCLMHAGVRSHLKSGAVLHRPSPARQPTAVCTVQ